MSDAYERAAAAIRDADAIFIGAGAGMGVDSGLPDFRGNEGFWRAYPPFAKLGLKFSDLADPKWFTSDPGLAWGFYGHRLNLYRETTPHAGFHLLQKWAAVKDGGLFVFTSNVDGQFQRAGIDDAAVCECHGSIHHLQCLDPCCADIWDADGTNVLIDEQFRAREPLPGCRACNGLARPNILMFGDLTWLSSRSEAQMDRMRVWLGEVRRGKVVVVECGAGTAIPTVRWQCERVASAYDAPLIRINPRESFGPSDSISIAEGAATALQKIDEHL